MDAVTIQAPAAVRTSGRPWIDHALEAAPWALWAGLLAFIVWRRFLYGFEWDELEHLHAGWEVGQGRVPYRDFFEHHPPIFYYLLAPLVRGCREITPGLLAGCRAYGVAVLVALAAGQCALMRKAVGRAAAAWGLVPCLILCPLPGKIVEARPDWLSLALLTWGMVLLHGAMGRGGARGRAVSRSTASAVGAGLAMGLASWTSQKAWVGSAAVGFWAVGSVLAADRADRSRRGKALACWAVGAAAVPLLGWLPFAASGAGAACFRHVVVMNFHWPQEVHGGWRRYAARTVSASLGPLTVAFAVAARALLRPVRRLRTNSVEPLLAAVLAVGVAAYVTTPVPFEQSLIYSVTAWAGMLAVVGACRYAALGRVPPADVVALTAAAVVCLRGVPLRVGVGVAPVWLAAACAGAYLVTRPGDARRRALLGCAFTAFACVGGYAWELHRNPEKQISAQEFAYARDLRDAAARYPRLLVGDVSPAPFHHNPTYHWYLAKGVTAEADAEYAAALRAGEFDAVAGVHAEGAGGADIPRTAVVLRELFEEHGLPSGHPLFVRKGTSGELENERQHPTDGAPAYSRIR